MTIKNKNKRDDWGKYHGLSGQVAVKYRQNVGSLSIDMLADNRTTTLSRHIDQHISQVAADISTDARLICRSICRPTHLGRHIDQHSTDTSVESIDIDWYIGRGVHKIHMIHFLCLPRYKLLLLMLLPFAFYIYAQVSEGHKILVTNTGRVNVTSIISKFINLNKMYWYLCVDRYISGHVGRHSADISTEICRSWMPGPSRKYWACKHSQYYLKIYKFT